MSCIIYILHILYIYILYIVYIFIYFILYIIYIKKSRKTAHNLFKIQVSDAKTFQVLKLLKSRVKFVF